ncbi:hypothetical protein BDQ12DRAFT_728541 [Crucibulum laeve]|uniref:DUF6533 domain-containing protein n=1 Tax=Crucibulum laeve TaxID=68775 RepID=A0A5C3LID7_9AGAR|nr:hypothetical protein BDQ12DRAFT_728541 [Crucibulum laeve]
MSQNQLQQLYQLIEDGKTTDYFTAMSITLLVWARSPFILRYVLTNRLHRYDHLMTLPDEIELIWRRRWNATGLLYVYLRELLLKLLSIANTLQIWNRYASLALGCFLTSFLLRPVGSDAMESVFTIFNVSTADVVLAYRSRSLLFGLGALLIMQFIAVFVITNKFIDSLHHFLKLGPVLNGCYATDLNLPTYMKYHLVVLMISSTIMCSLSTYRCTQSLRENGWKGMPTMTLFLRDGVFWFIVVFAFSTAQVLISTKARPTLANVLSAPTVAVYCMAASRVLLNIKGLVASTQIGGPGIRPTDFTLSEFRAGSDFVSEDSTESHQTEEQRKAGLGEV